LKPPNVIATVLTFTMLITAWCEAGLLPAFAKAKGKNTGEPSDKNFKLGVERFRERDYDGAIDALLQSVYFARNSYAPESYFWLGKAYMAKHEDAKAVEAFQKHLKQTIHDTADAHAYIAEIHFRNGRLAEAESEANEAVGAAPTIKDRARGYNVIGKCQLARKEYMNAEWNFEQALGQDPWTFTEAWTNLAECFMKAKNFVTAYNTLQNIIAARKRLELLDLPKVYVMSGVCLLSKGDHQGAIDNFHKALELDPGYADAHLQLGVIFDAEQHIQSAIKEYDEFIRVSNDEVKKQKAKERIILLQQKMDGINPNQTPQVQFSLPQQLQRKEQQAQQQQLKQQPPADSGF
jgi:tetratricopeptide (TPR) repeat protein